MIRITIWTLALSLTLARAAVAGPTAQQKCEGACDWRMPTVEELRTILAAQYPDCPAAPPPASCTTIPGLTNTNPMSGGYWTATTDDHDPTKAWVVSFRDGFISSQPKAAGGFVRAVRGEM
jgi:hypothetical protein